VFEDDVLSFSSQLTATHPLRGGRLLAFRVLVHAERESVGQEPVVGERERTLVLDWQPVVFAA
jgi:hypothetical protein